MNRIQPMDPEKLDEKSKEILNTLKAKLGRVPNIFKTMIHAPAAVEAYMGLSGALGHGVLPAKVREQIALAVGEDNQCHYCVSAHAAIGKSIGLTAEEIEASRIARASDRKVNAILKFAKALVKNRGHISDKELEETRKAGCSDEEIIETLAAVALNIYTNYFNHVADPAIDFPQAEPLKIND